MAVIVKYGQTRLIDSGKKGILRPDSDGYYEQPIGMLNCLNSAGAFYVKDGINEIMGQGSSFFRRIKEGALYAELEHPEQRPGEDMRTFLRRASKIDRNKYIREVYEDGKIVESSDMYVVPLQSVHLSAVGTFNKMTGAYFIDGIISGLVNDSDQVGNLEAVYRA